MFRFKGFRTSLNFSKDNISDNEKREAAESVSPFGVYKKKDEFPGIANVNVLQERTSIKKAAKSMPDLRTKQTDPKTNSNRIDISQPSASNQIEIKARVKEQQIQPELKPNKSSIQPRLITAERNEPKAISPPANTRNSTPDVSSNKRNDVPAKKSNVGTQETLSARQIKKRDADIKAQVKKQKELEKKHQLEQKKREKEASKELQKQEKLNQKREKQLAKESKSRDEANKSKGKTKGPIPRLPPESNNPPLPPELPTSNKTEPLRPTNPLAQNTVPSKSQGYSTNTLESSISKSSGPPPYIETVKPKTVPNKTDNTGNTSFVKPEDASSWDVISQHRQELNRAIRARQEKPKQMVMDLNYNFGKPLQPADNSEA